MKVGGDDGQQPDELWSDSVLGEGNNMDDDLFGDSLIDEAENTGKPVSQYISKEGTAPEAEIIEVTNGRCFTSVDTP